MEERQLKRGLIAAPGIINRLPEGFEMKEACLWMRCVTTLFTGTK